MTTAVSIVALALSVVSGGAAIVLLNRTRAIRTRTRTLELRVAALTPAPPMPPELEATFGAGERRLLAVEILNPVELATSKTKAAALLGAMRPALLTKVVYDQAAKQVVDQLESEGVLADVQVHRAR